MFSLNDLEEGKVSFFHTGVSTSRLAVRVSDGLKVSSWQKNPTSCNIKNERYKAGARFTVLTASGMAVMDSQFVGENMT